MEDPAARMQNMEVRQKELTVEARRQQHRSQAGKAALQEASAEITRLRNEGDRGGQIQSLPWRSNG